MDVSIFLGDFSARNNIISRHIWRTGRLERVSFYVRNRIIGHKKISPNLAYTPTTSGSIDENLLSLYVLLGE